MKEALLLFPILLFFSQEQFGAVADEVTDKFKAIVDEAKGIECEFKMVIMIDSCTDDSTNNCMVKKKKSKVKKCKGMSESKTEIDDFQTTSDDLGVKYTLSFTINKKGKGKLRKALCDSCEDLKTTTTTTTTAPGIRYPEVSMSSQHPAFPPRFCFDGIMNNFCHTDDEGEPNPWLSIKLPEQRKIQKVRVYNREDCCGFRFREAVVIVGSTSPQANQQPFVDGTQLGDKFLGGLADGASHDFEGDNPIRGNVVTIQLRTTEILNLREVMIFPSDGDFEVSMSSQHPDHPPINCFDGILNNFCHTSDEGELNPWLSIKLPLSVWIKKVTVYNREDCCGYRFYQAVAIVGSTSPQANQQIFNNGTQLGDIFLGGLPDGASHNFEGDQPLYGNVVTIQLRVTEILNLAEVNVVYATSD